LFPSNVTYLYSSSAGMADRHVEVLVSRNQSVRVPVSVVVIFADLG
jgi:hypothetical protein